MNPLFEVIHYNLGMIIIYVENDHGTWYPGADPGYGNGGGKVGARGAREILLINIHYSLKSLDFIA